MNIAIAPSLITSGFNKMRLTILDKEASPTITSATWAFPKTRSGSTCDATQFIILSILTGSVSFSFGGDTPTASAGMVLPVGTYFLMLDKNTLSNMKAISATGTYYVHYARFQK